VGADLGGRVIVRGEVARRRVSMGAIMTSIARRGSRLIESTFRAADSG